MHKESTSTTEALAGGAPLGEGSIVAVVLGARGGAGKEVVKALLANQSVSEVRAVVRDPSKVASGTFPEDPRCKIVAGDLQHADEEELKAVFAGATLVFNTSAGRSYEACVAVDCNAVGATAAMAKAAGCQRYLLCSSQLVDPINKDVFIRLILNNVITGKFFKKQKGAMASDGLGWPRMASDGL
eukprot:jgi/Chrpa1/95/Chrysochromulina_OHIO_Genome00015821-RA